VNYFYNFGLYCLLNQTTRIQHSFHYSPEAHRAFTFVCLLPEFKLWDFRNVRSISHIVSQLLVLTSSCISIYFQTGVLTAFGSKLTTNTKYALHYTLNLNSVNQLIFVMVKYGVLYEVRTGFLNNI
jgi:hypothetical protein